MADIESAISALKVTGVPPGGIGWGATSEGLRLAEEGRLRLSCIVTDDDTMLNQVRAGVPLVSRTAISRGREDGPLFVAVLDSSAFDDAVRYVREQRGHGHTVMRFLPRFEMVMT